MSILSPVNAVSLGRSNAVNTHGIGVVDPASKRQNAQSDAEVPATKSKLFDHGDNNNRKCQLMWLRAAESPIRFLLTIRGFQSRLDGCVRFRRRLQALRPA